MVKTEMRDESQQKLRVLILSLQLMKYTMEIASNKNVFLPIGDFLTNEILSETMMLYRTIFRANNLNLRTKHQQRFALQKDANSICNDLLSDILCAEKLFHLRAKRVKYWTEQVLEIQKRLKAWHDSDRKRLKENGETYLN